MKKKLLMGLLSMAFVGASAVAMGSCSFSEIPHPHVWGEVETIAPTCKEQGYDTKTCKICGEVEVENYTAIVDHDWNEEYSCDTTFHWVECNTCDEIKDKQEHTITDSGECSVCGGLVGATVGVLYDISTDRTYAEVIGYEGTATKIRIADTYEGLPVKTIYEWAFEGCSSLTSVVIPDSVTSIGNYAFFFCESLTSVEIGDSVTSIGDGAFEYCSSLTSVEIGDSVTSIGNSAFYSCYKLVEVVNRSPSITIEKGETTNGYVGYYALAVYNSGDTFVSKLSNENGYIIYTDGSEKILVGYVGQETDLVFPSFITQINQYAFDNCESLTSVVIGDSVTAIGQQAFYNCDSLTSVVIGDSVTTIGDSAFRSCSSLTSGVIGDSVTSIGNYAFFFCESLTSVEIGDSVTSIGDGAFEYCSSLTSVEIGDSVTSIGDGAFEYCSSLTSVEIGDSVTSIGNSAFYKCSSLTSITIPDSVTSMGERAFRNCSSLTSIEVSEENTAYKDIDGNLYSKDGSILIQYAIGKTATEFIIPDSVTWIGYGAFCSCSSLTSVVIGDSVTSIGNSAFRNCSSLTSVVIGDSVTSIGGDAFSDCSSLTSVVIGDSVTSIGGDAFSDCSSLTSVVIGDSVTSIGYSAFSNCDSLTSVVIGDSVTSIGDWVFRDCDSLMSVYYKGTESEWAEISIGSSNAPLTNAKRYYYSESEPTTEGNYWRYVDGVPTAW